MKVALDLSSYFCPPLHIHDVEKDEHGERDEGRVVFVSECRYDGQESKGDQFDDVDDETENELVDEFVDIEHV